MTVGKGGRPRLAPGTFGSVSVQNVGPSRYRARARYCGQDGVTRTVARFGQTKGAARDALHSALEDRQRGEATIDRAARIDVLLDRWLIEIDQSKRAVQTKDLYRYLVGQYVRARMGRLAIGDASTGRVDAVLQSIAADNGPSVARSVRAVLNGVFGLAIRHGALQVNPVRETRPISTAPRLARALTTLEVEDITDRLRSDERALYLDLADLVDFALDTGCRIGELLALRETDCDLEAGTVTVRGTVVRKRGEKLAIQTGTKSAAGERVLALPPQAIDLLRRRRGELRFRSPDGVVFGSPLARRLRDPSNCAGDLREVLNRYGYQWVTFHSFRKTVATRLDEAGLTSREVADQLGHSQPSMTMNVYMGRRVQSPRAAAALAR